MATPKEVVKGIGREYVTEFDSEPDRNSVRQAFQVMAERNRELFDEIPTDVVFQSEDPYDDYQDMRDTVGEEGILRVFSGGELHPIWDHTDELISRAVHDWYGHLGLDVDFSPTGEFLKWQHARRHYPAFCANAFFTEVVGQLGAVHYLPESFDDPRFEQKVFAAPQHWIEQMSRAVYYDE